IGPEVGGGANLVGISAGPDLPPHPALKPVPRISPKRTSRDRNFLVIFFLSWAKPCADGPRTADRAYDLYIAGIVARAIALPACGPPGLPGRASGGVRVLHGADGRVAKGEVDHARVLAAELVPGGVGHAVVVAVRRGSPVGAKHAGPHPRGAEAAADAIRVPA